MAAAIGWWTLCSRGAASKIVWIEEHYKAGATHACILPLPADKKLASDERTMEVLAPR